MTSAALPTETDIVVSQGATYSMRVTWNDQQATPQPISLAEYRAYFQIRTKRGGAGAIIASLSSEGENPALTLEPADTNGNPMTGVVEVRIGADVTRLLRRNAFYDLFVVLASDYTESVRLVYGQVIVSLSASTDPDLPI